MMETTDTEKVIADLKIPDKDDDDMKEGLRLLFRNKYVQAEPAAKVGLHPMVPDHSVA